MTSPVISYVHTFLDDTCVYYNRCKYIAIQHGVNKHIENLFDKKEENEECVIKHKVFNGMPT